MEIFLSCCQTATDMSLCLIHFQHLTNRLRQFRVYPLYPVRDILVHRTLTDAEFLRRFPHSGIGMDHKFRDLDRPFLNISLQTKHSSKYRLVMYMPELGWI